MKSLNSILFVSFLALSTNLFAQGHEHHGGAAPAPEAQPQAQNLAEIDPAAKDRGDCEKCKKKGMGGMHGDGGMGDCKCKKGGGMGGDHQGHGGGGMGGGHEGHGDGGCPKAAALEDRIDELEKRLDLLQMLMMRGYR